MTNGKVIGREIWQSSAKLNEWQIAAGQKASKASTSFSVLEQFQSLPDCGEFSLSAIIEIQQSPVDELSLSGSPVLTVKAKAHASEDVRILPSTVKALRAPYLLIDGATAEEVAHAVICEYSDYVGALFDNFD